ncbi:MAG: DsbA family oxidoreductase [Betaproteobacteria bacterium]|nr:DsbA family oxidoreductase [Betaproteobacteria bacterium]MBV9360457.1 DsbA family oxidoreductase [Betaproteobacteria bacterium]
MQKELVIEIASDVICPWCYIGKRRLEKALALLDGEVKPDIRWLPFQLNPDMPQGGMPRAEYRRAKFGSVERGRQLDARVAAEGRGEGIDFAFDRMERTPNTTAAHQLIDVAQREGKGQAVVDALFQAYFEEACDIGNPDVLQTIAASAGVQGWPAQANPQEVAEREEGVRNLGISAVPTFILARKFGVSGAHPPESLAAAIKEALK